jgi:hypothetical protein
MDMVTLVQREAVLKKVVGETDTTMIGMSLTTGTHMDITTLLGGMMMMLVGPALTRLNPKTARHTTTEVVSL